MTGTKGENVIDFLKKHSKMVSNVAVLLLVLGAIYVKSSDPNAQPVFHMQDAYMLAGAVLAFIVLNMIAKYHRAKQEKKDRKQP